MVSLREFAEQRGNQGREEEEGGVLSVEPITMIVPPELQDMPETMASESSTSSSASDNGGDHPSTSSSSSSEGTPGREEEAGDVVSHVSDRPVMGEWESRTVPGRLSNMRKAPKDLPAGFRFKAALHHEVADCTPSVKRKGVHSVADGLDTSVRGPLRRRPAVSPARPGIQFARGVRVGADAANAQQHKVHHGLYAVVCKIGGAS
ncbi:hypothetical protein SLEP1_g51872 [Rubroshorea leprosula]|uniref:Uncharacterized protein n=1 Tax=Rubroshorea leprosula TaxID=152421 RepID=A0AAV5M5E8_9ROSI|nr:hypothetical protein SLEP1_g51872 [Rubroshorea leprosula]